MSADIVTGHTPDETETTVPADRLPLTAATERAWRLTIEHHGAVPLGAFNWPWALSLALNEAGRLRDEVRALRARDQEVERLRLIRRRILNTVDPAMPGPDVRLAAVAVVDEAANALAALSQSGQPTKGQPA